MFQNTSIHSSNAYLSDEADLSKNDNYHWVWKIVFQVVSVVLAILIIAFLQSVVLGNNL